MASCGRCGGGCGCWHWRATRSAHSLHPSTATVISSHTLRARDCHTTVLTGPGIRASVQVLVTKSSFLSSTRPVSKAVSHPPWPLLPRGRSRSPWMGCFCARTPSPTLYKTTKGRKGIGAPRDRYARTRTYDARASRTQERPCCLHRRSRRATPRLNSTPAQLHRCRLATTPRSNSMGPRGAHQDRCSLDSIR